MAIVYNYAGQLLRVNRAAVGHSWLTPTLHALVPDWTEQQPLQPHQVALPSRL